MAKQTDVQMDRQIFQIPDSPVTDFSGQSLKMLMFHLSIVSNEYDINSAFYFIVNCEC